MRASTKLFGLASVFLTAALFASLFTLSSRAARADGVACPHVTNGHAFFVVECAEPSSAVISGGQATMEPDDCTPPIHVVVTLSNNQVVDVTNNVSTTAPQGAGTISGHVYCAAAGDLNKQFPIYSIYKDPCTGQMWTFTVSVHVVGNDHDADDQRM